MTNIERVVKYMELKGFQIFRGLEEMNIVYLEGVNSDYTNNADQWDRFNDRRIVFTFVEGRPIQVFNVSCTTEPGKKPTFSLAALLRGGIFRIQFGQWLECWEVGYHKGRKDHEALVQAPGAVILGHRDYNRDGKRTGDKISKGEGINQHGTSPKYNGFLVSDFSEGCLVGHEWADQRLFMFFVKSDIRYRQNPKFRFSSTIIAGDDFNRVVPQKQVA